MRDREAWTYLGTGQVVEWSGQLYFVQDVLYVPGKPEKDRVTLHPLNASRVIVGVSRNFPYDRNETTGELITNDRERRKALDEGDEIEKAVRLDGIKKVADNVEELIMRRLKKVLFNP